MSEDQGDQVDPGGSSPPTAGYAPRIAVLPFANTGSDPEQDYLGEGLAAEILIYLARISGLHLVARSAVFSLKSDGMALEDVARALDAAYLLRGTVGSDADTLSITAELVNAVNGQTLWKGAYAKDVSDVFEVLDAIAEGISGAFDVGEENARIRDIQTIHSNDVGAYDLYLRGRQRYYDYSRAGVEDALEQFEGAIELDDSYALAYCGLSDCYSYLYMYVEGSDENRSRAESASRRALELDSELAEAHASHGVALSLSGRFEEAAQSFETAVRLDPQLFEAHYFYARTCFVQGKLNEAIEQFKAAREARPEDYQSPLLMGQIYDTLGEHEKAESIRQEGVEVAERHLEFHAHDTRALYMAANGLVVLGQEEKGLEWLQLALSLEPYDAMLLYNAGCIYALLGRSDEALTCLERTVEGGLTQREWYEHDSNLDSLRSLDRFKVLLDSMA